MDPRFRAQGPFSDTAMVKLVVENVDEPPVFTMPVSRMVVSEAAKVGTIIGTVSATDPDSTNSPIRFGTRPPRTGVPSSWEIRVTVCVLVPQRLNCSINTPFFLPLFLITITVAELR